MRTLILSILAAVCLTACSNYGKKVKDHHIEVYYKEGISKEDAEKTAKLLYESDIAAGNSTDKKVCSLPKRAIPLTSAWWQYWKN